MNDTTKVINQALESYNKLREDENGRFRSWEYCYKIFHDAHNADKVDNDFIDYLCLHLSFYLASWGMYRGSSFLLQKDYKVHKPIIEELLKDEYNSLWGIEVKEYKDTQNQIKLENLVRKMKEIYNDIRLRVKVKENEEDTIPKNEISNTLITKVLMGTLGCVPAYDRCFLLGIASQNVASRIFNVKSILELANFYTENSYVFENAKSKMTVNGMLYPQMKILDGCFWQIGYELDKENKKNKENKKIKK